VDSERRTGNGLNLKEEKFQFDIRKIISWSSDQTSEEVVWGGHILWGVLQTQPERAVCNLTKFQN